MSNFQESDGQTGYQRNLYTEYREINHRSIHELLSHYVVRVFGKVGFVAASFVFSVPMMGMLAIGIIYRLDCPIQAYIPVYLIMSGLVSILILAWLILTQLDIRYIRELKFYIKMHKIQWFFITMLLIWCALGCYFVFSIALPEESACHPILFSYALFVVSAQLALFLILFAFFLCIGCSCCKYCCYQPSTSALPIA